VPPIPMNKPTKLAVLGAINWDTTVFVRRFAEPGDEVPVLKLEEFPGGKGANVASASARLLGPGRVAFIGAVGNDPVGSRLIEGLVSEGVHVDGVEVLPAKTGHALIIVDDEGRKAVHTSFGANDALAPASLRSPGAKAVLSEANTTVIMDVPLPAAFEAARAANEAGSRVIFSPCVRSGLGLARLRPVLDLTDTLVLDRGELSRVSGTPRLADGVATLRAALPLVTVVVTRGRSGSLVAERGKTTAIPAVDPLSMGLRSVNATGAGDAFLAAFACYSMEGCPAPEAARWGNLAGALKTASEETRGSPTRDELEGRMRARFALRRRRPGSPSKIASSRSRRRS